jgi:hypothetical protein
MAIDVVRWRCREMEMARERLNENATYLRKRTNNRDSPVLRHSRSSAQTSIFNLRLTKPW